MTSPTLLLAKELISKKSITPIDDGCQALMINRLMSAGFSIEKMDFDDTENFWALRKGKSCAAPVFIFAGHTDVVPPGDLTEWSSDPFVPTIRGDFLYGRGAADMKTSLAAMITATESFIEKHPNHSGSIGFLITSDEEGPFINGTTRVVDELLKRQQRVDYALVGEPSSTDVLGDVIKNGRRGSLTGWLDVRGTQGHVAYPHLAKNAFHESILACSELVNKTWDEGNEHFPATSFQFTDIRAGAGAGAGNIIPGRFHAEFNFRYSTEQTSDGLKQQVESILHKHKLNYDIRWKLNGEPFLTPRGTLLNACAKALLEIARVQTKPQTSGGTSDGRFIAKLGAQVIELGPVNASIHKVDERVKVSDIELLANVYQRILELTIN